jgi:hypothetical protein
VICYTFGDKTWAYTYPEFFSGDEPVLAGPECAHHRSQLLSYGSAGAVWPDNQQSFEQFPSQRTEGQVLAIRQISRAWRKSYEVRIFSNIHIHCYKTVIDF